MAVADLDPVRASLLTSIAYRTRNGEPSLAPFYEIRVKSQERISYLLGGRYDELRQWIIEAIKLQAEPQPLDHVLSKLFGEVLSQPGFGFHGDFDAGAVAANLIESVAKFRQGVGPLNPEPDERTIGLEYVDMVERGVVGAQYVASWRAIPEEAVLIVPGHTFLMMNRPVTVQFWLDAGSRAWIERIYQPLTHPYVLRRDWAQGEKWLDKDEIRVRHESLERMILGLSRRCRQRIYLAFSELDERGYEQQGPLLQSVQRLLRRLERESK
jgi:hypothetical protein